MTEYVSDPQPPGAGYRVSVWALSGERTGPYLGAGVLAATDFVVLHPKTACALRRRREATRARVAVDTPFARYVVDGSVVLPNDGVPEDAVALELDMPIAETPEKLPAPALGTPESEFDDLERFLADHEARDTAPPPEKPEATGYTRRPRPSPARRPWWCRIWPGCRGCR
ncbi:hypothetical protein [Mobilicoccus massiliensis]|uniref:hypothetical protein n=1 Tax=Mobilicoccus massiliensis TaxID=1522310 RepID=UPI0005905D08|nr:hypothetical protein [Mobilicoccus massiliensis]